MSISKKFSKLFKRDKPILKTRDSEAKQLEIESQKFELYMHCSKGQVCDIWVTLFTYLQVCLPNQILNFTRLKISLCAYKTLNTCADENEVIYTYIWGLKFSQLINIFRLHTLLLSEEAELAILKGLYCQ